MPTSLLSPHVDLWPADWHPKWSTSWPNRLARNRKVIVGLADVNTRMKIQLLLLTKPMSPPPLITTMLSDSSGRTLAPDLAAWPKWSVEKQKSDVCFSYCFCYSSLILLRHLLVWESRIGIVGKQVVNKVNKLGGFYFMAIDLYFVRWSAVSDRLINRSYLVSTTGDINWQAMVWMQRWQSILADKIENIP